MRNFGDPSDLEEFTGNKPLNDWGKIVGSSAGDIYFAFTSLPEPLLRKYDRYGYVGYETSVPKNFFDSGETASTDRVEVRFNFAHVSLSDQTSGWIGIGSSGDVKFGGGMGTGLSRVLGSGGSLGRAGMQPTGFGSAGGGTIGGTFSAQLSDEGSQFQFGAGNISLQRGGRGRGGGNANSDQETPTPQGSTLQFFGAENGSTDQPFSQAVEFTGPDSGAQDENSAEASASQDFGLTAAFFYGTMFNSVTFQPQGPFWRNAWRISGRGEG